jgi:hypothetical protein
MASSDHTWDKCPNQFRVAKMRPGDVDLDKQCHYYHDSAGCPFTCTEDHNHPLRVTTARPN